MATAAQVKSLILSHFSDNPEAFNTLVLQIAAQEANQGHYALAVELRDLLDQQRKVLAATGTAFSLPSQLEEYVLYEKPVMTRAQLVVPKIIQRHLDRIVLEFRQRSKLRKNGLQHRRRLLLNGPPGTGKTMTARVLANELHLPLLFVRMERLISRYLGESSSHLRLIFDFLKDNTGVYLFDEFDAMGADRLNENDIGEMRRVLNAFLALLDQDQSDSLIIAATNTPRLLDTALCRRFDDILVYQLPDAEVCEAIVRNLLSLHVAQSFPWSEVVASCGGLSQAEVTLACNDALKQMILDGKELLTEQMLLDALEYRKAAKSAMLKG